MIIRGIGAFSFGAVTTAAIAVLSPLSQAKAQNCIGWAQRVVSGPSARYYHAMVYDTQRAVSVLFGGQTFSSELGDTWEYNGTQWNQKPAGIAPRARTSHAMAYDSQRGVSVLFGGIRTGVGRLADTWEWDGSQWALRVTSDTPPARSEHAMAYDSSRLVTVMLGGSVGNGLYTSDTWEYDGLNWTFKTAAGPSPSGAVGCVMAYDADRQNVVMFNVLNQTWTWNGTAWSLRATTGPAMAQRLAMAYDGVRHTVQLFGVNRFGTARETWEWNGSAWTMTTSSSGPVGRIFSAMVYDSARKTEVLFGGASMSGTLFADTWEASQAVIVSQPAPQSAAVGGSMSMSVVVASNGAVGYQWRRDGQPLADGGPISGATTSTITISPFAAAEAGDFDVVISTPCGQLVSQTAHATALTTSCNLADITGIGGPPAIPDGLITGDDFVAFINAFAEGDLLADITGIGGPPAIPDFLVTGDDFITFINEFAAGCP